MGTTSLEASCENISGQNHGAMRQWVGTDHASAGEDVPTEADTITVLDLTPLLLELLVIHLGRVLGRMQICN